MLPPFDLQAQVCIDASRNNCFLANRIVAESPLHCQRLAVPGWLATLFEGLDEDPDTRRLIACSVATEMCARLEEEGFSDFHFYTLNRADLVYAICRVLGVREEEQTA